MGVGIVVFVLIIVAGFIAGMRLSSTGPQRRAVAVAFAAMAIVAVLFYLFAMRASQLWTAPVFAVACIAVPIGAYAALMRSDDQKGVTRRNIVEVPRAQVDGSAYPPRQSSPLDAAVMPVAPAHPVNEYQDLSGQFPPIGDGYQAGYEPIGEEISQASGEITPFGGYQELYIEEDEFELAEDMEAPAYPVYGSSPAPDFEEDDFELAEDMDESSPSDTGALSRTPMASAPQGTDRFAPVAPEPVATLPESPAEQLLDEALMEENEDQDASGLFEPEIMPDPTAAQPTTSVTSTTVVAVPSEGGDEEFLVVSESTEAPNPLMAYKRTTSSHLVPLGPSQRVAEGGTPEPAGHPRIELAQESELASPASTAVIMSVVSRELDAMRQVDAPFEPNTGLAPEMQPSLFDEPPVEAEVPFYGAPEMMAEDLFGGYAPEPLATYAPAASEAAYEPQIANTFSGNAQPQPAFETPPEYADPSSFAPVQPASAAAPAPQPGGAPVPLAAEAFEPAPEPAAAYEPRLAPAPAAAYEPRPASVPEPAIEPRPAREQAPKPTFSYQPLIIEPVPERTAPAAVLEPETSSPEPAPAAAPSVVAKPAFEPEPEPESPKTLYEIALEKADGLQDRGLYAVAARLYAQAAEEAPTNDKRRHALFEEIACYLKAGQKDKARDLASQLRSSSVLTRSERIKLDAIGRMG